MATLEERRAAEDAAASTAAEKIERLIRGAMDSAADGLEAYRGAYVPDDYEQAIEGVLIAAWTDAAKRAGRLVIDEFKDLYDLETKQAEESLFEQIIREFLEMFGARSIGRIAETTREQIALIILEGQKRGQTLPEIATAIRAAAPGIALRRSLIIARTETHSSGAYASHRVAQSARKPLMKEWASVQDHRTRDFGEGDGIIDEFNHRAMNGIKVALDQPYMVPMRTGGAEPLMFPGDPNASAGNRINCRCQELYTRAE